MPEQNLDLDELIIALEHSVTNMDHTNTGSLEYQAAQKLKELQKIINQAVIFTDDVMPQVGKLCIQDFMNLNDLLMGLSANKSI